MTMELIKTVASAEQLENAYTSKHIRSNELNRLIEQMTGQLVYRPRLGGSGQKLKCKSDYCNNIALDGGRKQLCPTHYVNFLERSNASQLIPNCEYCNNKTRHVFEDDSVCNNCSDEILQERRNITQMAYDACLKTSELENAETVQELRAWIKEYML